MGTGMGKTLLGDGWSVKYYNTVEANASAVVKVFEDMAGISK